MKLSYQILQPYHCTYGGTNTPLHNMKKCNTCQDGIKTT